MSHTVQVLAGRALSEARALLAAAIGADAAAVAEEKLFGDALAGPPTPLAVRCDDELAGVAVASASWLRLLAVHPRHRGRGVGSALLAAVETLCRQAGTSELRALDEPGNYLSPGIATEDLATLRWLERRGFQRGALRANLIIDLADNPKISRTGFHTLAATAGYPLRRVQDRARPSLCAWVEREFSAGWAFQVARGETYVALDEAGEPAGFASHDGNNRGLGWFGPAGTLPRYRGHGLGAALLMACLLDVAEAGHAQCTIAWIGPRGFYERVAGVAGQRDYVAMSKELS